MIQAFLSQQVIDQRNHLFDFSKKKISNFINNSIKLRAKIIIQQYCTTKNYSFLLKVLEFRAHYDQFKYCGYVYIFEMQKVIPIKLDERTLPEQQPTEQVMEVQCLICAQGRELFQVGECRHRCCLECYIEAVQEQLRLRNEGGCFQCSNPLLQTSNPNYVYIHLPERLKQKLANLSQILPSRCQMCDGTTCTCLPEGPPCDDVKQCIKCRAWIEKKKGCSHVKCQCGVEFCFQCEQEWSHAHICPHRIPSRQGIMYFVCMLVKIFLGLLIFSFLLVIFLFVACCICSISAAMLGFMTLIRLLEKTGKAEINDCAKLLLVLMLFVFMPVFSAVLFVPGFLLPVVNLCWHKTIFFDHAILGDWFYRLFSCLIILQVL